MAELFIQILNMSISALWLILVVLVLRITLKKAPKWVRVLLWGLVAVRLLCPFSLESTLSLLPSAEVISPQILLDTVPTLDTGISSINEIVNPLISGSNTPDVGASINPMQISFALLALLWLIGVAMMLGYAVVSYLLLYGRVRTAVRIRDNLYQSEFVESPFVLGIFRPRIYLPFRISAHNMDYVIAHEKAHIRRKDHWWKPLGFILLTLHWFNPLVWLAYILLCRDIELACDEKVIKELGVDARADYSAALLSCSIQRHRIAACPVAFGEVGVKGRIKSVLSYKRPAFWMILLALILCCAVAVCFLTNPPATSSEPDLSFLNYENAAALVIDSDEVQTIYCPPSQKGTDNTINVGAVNGKDLAVYLDNCDWRMVKEPNSRLPSPGSIEFVIADDHRIQIYQRTGLSLHGYAVVTYAEEKRYYSISNSDYTDAVDLLYAPEIIDEINLWKVTREGDSYYLTVGSEDVVEIGISTPDSSGGCINADGSLFQIGERVWLEQLDGVTDLTGVSIQALDAQGYILYLASLPVAEADRKFESNTIQYLTEGSAILPIDQWMDGIAFENLKPNEEILSDFEIVLTAEESTIEFNITWARSGLTLEYGIRSVDGIESMVRSNGGSSVKTYNCIPAGTYRLFVRNTDYTGVPAYENPSQFPDVDFSATGALNYRVK